MHSLPKLLSLARENVVKITFCTVNKSHTAVHIVVPRRRRQRQKYMNVSFDCGGKCEMYSNYQRQNTGASEKRQNWIRGWERKSGNRRKAIRRGRQSGTQAKKLTDITRVQRARCRSEKWEDMTSRWRSEWWRRWNTRAQWQWAGALHEMTVPENYAAWESCRDCTQLKWEMQSGTWIQLMRISGWERINRGIEKLQSED